ncbi:hypothetical protein M8494_01655 [Serratia ureilytica]
MLSRHDFSKVNWGILAAAALLFSVGAALLVLPLLSSIDEQVITLLQAGAGTVLLGCTLLALRLSAPDADLSPVRARRAGL